MNKGSDHNIKKVAGAFQSSAKDIAATKTGATDVPGARTGATDVPVGQGPKGLSESKDKLLRSFANGDVCGSCNVAGGYRSSAKGHAAKDKAELQQAPATPITPPRKVDLPVDQKPAGLCGEKKGSLLRSEVNGDVNLPIPTPPPPQKPIRAIRVIRGQNATPPPPNPLCASVSPRLCVKKEDHHA